MVPNNFPTLLFKRYHRFGMRFLYVWQIANGSWKEFENGLSTKPPWFPAMSNTTHGRSCGSFMVDLMGVSCWHSVSRYYIALKKRRWEIVETNAHTTPSCFFVKRSPLTMWKSSLALVVFRVKRCWGIGVFSGNTPRMCKDFEYEGWLPRAPKTYMFRCFLWYRTWFLGGQNLYFSWFWGLMVSKTPKKWEPGSPEASKIRGNQEKTEVF